MPNWCQNVVNIDFPNIEQGQQVVAAFEKGQLLNTLVPEPNDIGDGWYSWRVANWGTKWDVEGSCDCWTQDDNLHVVLTFDSAWAPPLQALHALADNYDAQVSACYSEPGMQFCGVWSPGSDHQFTIPETREGLADLPQQLVDQFGSDWHFAEDDQDDDGAAS